jgi:type IV secretion system protein VirB9
MTSGAAYSSLARRRTTLSATALTLWLLVAVALADPVSDPRLRVVDYRPTLVLPLTAFVGYHVHFEFAPGEYFVNLGAGDTSSLDVGAEGNHLLIKPKQPNGGTNLTILTNRRAYFVDYRALGRPPRADEAVYSIAFRYSDTAQPAAIASKDSSSAEALLGGPRRELNKDYWYCGSPSLRPISAVDDGLQLRLTFAPHAELPAVFAAEPDGEEAVVNTHVEDDSIVVHRLAERILLRRGREVGCVVDRSARQRERRAASGTIDEGIDRALRGVPR